MRRLAYPGFGGDAYPAETPQYQNDLDSRYQHDEPVDPASGDYNVFYGGGQLHVSPHHEHDELRGHAGITEDHTGPMAVGTVSVDRGRATWSIGGNVALRGLARVFKDYTKQVGWQWGGLTRLDGEPIDDDFAPKKSMVLRDHEFAVDRPFALQGKTAFVGKDFSEEMREALRSAGYRVAEYPGGGNMNDMLKNESPAGEDYEIFNRGENGGPLKTQDEDVPTGTFKCPDCGEIFHRWNEYLVHRKYELPEGDDEPESKFPPLPDYDKTLPNNWRPRQPFVMPLASVKDAERYEEFDDFADLLGIRIDSHVRSAVRHYGAFRNGEMVGVATVEGTVLRFLGGRTTLDRASLLVALQTHYSVLEAVEDEAVAEDLRVAGFVRHESDYRWAAGQQPKDMIDRPLPFIYDVQEDKIVVGHPGGRHADIPGKFTPGGIIEGDYLPGGKVHIHTMTNIPYTVRHMLDLWYWSFPHMEVTGVELHDSAGNKTKLAGSDKLSTVDVGHYIKQVAATDPAAWNAFQALRKAGGEVYVVGGAVRDALLQKEPKDIDLMVTGVPPEQVHRVLAGLPGRVDLTGKSFGVYRYNTRGHEVEIALPRTETSTGDRRVDFDVKVDHELPVEDDLLRRDFTVNAMAVNLNDGTLVDPYGGAHDIEQRALRTTHPSSFVEDPTRVLRALVMNSRYGFQPDEETRAQMAAHGHKLSNESWDNMNKIMDKLMVADNPARGIRLAQETGVLQHVFPEVAHNFDFDQNNPHHNFTLGDHLLNVVEGVAEHSKDPDLRLAALLHDIGKPSSAWTNPETGSNHYYRGPEGQGDNHEIVGAHMADKRLREMKYPVARIKRIKHLIEHHMFPAFSSAKGARKFLHRVGDEHADDLLTLRYADQRGKGQSPEELAARTHVDEQRGLVEQVRSAQEPTNQSALMINGSDVIALGVKPGPAVGQILRRLTDDVVEDPRLNDPELLKQRAQEYANAMA